MMKKSILFVVDKPNWAYEFMVRSWMPYLYNQFNCFLVYQTDYSIVQSKHNHILYHSLFNFRALLKGFDSEGKSTRLHKDGYFYNLYKKQKIYQLIDKDGSKKLLVEDKLNFDTIIEMAYYFQYTSHLPFKSTKKIVGLFTDAFPHEGPSWDIKRNIDRSKLDRSNFFKTYLSQYNHIIVGGGNLYNDYKKLTEDVSFVYGIFGEDNFVVNKSVGKKEHLTIGWTGNPNRPMKGFKEFIEPAIEKVRQTGRNIELKTKFSGSYEDLYTFYSDVDLVIIASCADSGPSLYAEACLSSVPTISTKVGLPLMGIEHGKTGLFIDRNIDNITDVLIDLYDNRSRLINFSKLVKDNYLEKLGNSKSVLNVLKILQ